jgi:hypothetical protein
MAIFDDDRFNWGVGNNGHVLVRGNLSWVVGLGEELEEE